MSSGSSARLAGLMREREISVRDMARHVGVSDVAVRKWLKGNEPSGDRLVKVCEYLGVTPAFLIFGDDNAPRQTVETDDGMLAVPLLDVQASCGGGYFEDEQQQRLSVVQFIKLNPLAISNHTDYIRRNSLNLITAIGDSMEPTIKNNTIVLVDTSQTEDIRDGLYVVAYAHQIFIKRIQITPYGINLLSDNRKYDKIPIKHREDFKVIGKCFLGFEPVWYS